MFGYQSETQMPLWPYCLKVRLVPISVLLPVPMAVMGLPKDAGIGCPLSSFSLGLGSKRSTWLGPPSMKSQMTDFAFGVMVRLLRGQGIGRSLALCQSLEQVASAMPARPLPARVKEFPAGGDLPVMREFV